MTKEEILKLIENNPKWIEAIGREQNEELPVMRTVTEQKLFQEGFIEETAQEIEQSLFRQEYLQAGKVLRHILQGQDNRGENIISFIGERGTGKTSVMRSFCKMLAEYEWNKTGYQHLLDKEKKYSFVQIKMIDASVLKTGEDIMSIVISRMLKVLREKLKNRSEKLQEEELRKLYQSFERVYNSINILGGHGREERAIRGIELQGLQTLVSSETLHDDFEILVQRFLNFTAKLDERISNQQEGRSNADNRWLVVSLDDIDLYHPKENKCGDRQDSYTLLAQIHDFLKVSHVIICVTYDEILLKHNCEKHLAKAFELDEDSAEKRTQAYLEKLAPARYKVYMPHVDRRDYPENFKMQVMLSPNGHNGRTISLFPKYQKLDTSIPIKQLTLSYIADRYGCFMDALGQKKHYFEEVNLRKLTDLLNALEVSDNETPEQRYLKILSYVCNHFAGAVLDSHEFQQFEQDWLSKTIDRRSRDIVQHVRTKRSKFSLSDRFYYREQTGEHWKYSYGELLYNIYASSRCGVFSKPMVHSIMASYSVVLPWLLNQCVDCKQKEMLAEDTEIKEKYQNKHIEIRQIINGVLGTSIAGKWANEILPTDFYSVDESTAPMGKPEQKPCASVSIVDKFELYFRVREPEIKNWVTLSEKEDKSQATRFINMLELCCMFFTNVKRSGLENQLNFNFCFESDGGDRILTSKSDKGCFNIFNFVIHSFNWREYFDSLHQSFIKAIIDRISAVPGERRVRIWRIWDHIIKSGSLKNEYEQWEKKYPDCIALPFQHFDMMYNIIKRQQDNSDHGIPAEAKPSEYLECCKTVYQNMSKALQEQDEYYNTLVSQNVCFQHAFEECPFIKHIFCENTKNEEDKALFDALSVTMEGIIRNMQPIAPELAQTERDILTFTRGNWRV